MPHRCGLYRAVVKNVTDPEGRGRIKVACAQLWGNDTTDWVWPCAPANSAALPAIGDQVWLGFEAGDEDHPVWLGTVKGGFL